MSAEEPTTKTTKTIIRRVVKKENPSFLSRHWQAGLVVVSLAVSGLVAWKVFNPRKKQPPQEQLIQQILAQQQQIQQLQQQQQQPPPELVAADPSQFVTMPLINGNGNGNGHHLGNLPPIPIDMSKTRKGPALSSWAEKMIQRDQFKNIPMINTPVDMPMMNQPQPQHPHQHPQQYGQPHQQQQIQNIPSAPPLQRPPLPGQSVSNEDIL